jgi:hypothetical protein
MTNDKKNKIIDDLLKKKPKGPKGADLTYDSKEEYCYDRRRYVRYYVCNDLGYGYGSRSLFKLGLHDKDDVREYVRNRWFEGQSSYKIGRKKSTVTRRTNRLWSRIEKAVRAQKTTGGKGIYKLSKGYRGDAFVYVFASSHDEAKTLGQVFFQLDPIQAKSDFIEFGTAEKLRNYNENLEKRFSTKIAGLEEEIKSAHARIESLKSHCTTMQVLSGHQIALGAEAA